MIKLKDAMKVWWVLGFKLLRLMAILNPEGNLNTDTVCTIIAHGLQDALRENPKLRHHLLVSVVSLLASTMSTVCGQHHLVHVKLAPHLFLRQGLWWRLVFGVPLRIVRGDGLSHFGIPPKECFPSELRPLVLLEGYGGDEADPLALWPLGCIPPSPELSDTIADEGWTHSLLHKPSTPECFSCSSLLQDATGVLCVMAY